MNYAMTPVEIIGLKSDLDRFLEVLRGVGVVHIDSVNESHEVLVRPFAPDAERLRRQEELSLLAARVDGLQEALRAFLPKEHKPPPVEKPESPVEIARAVEELLPAVQSLTRRRAELESELASLPLYETTLRKLLPLVPAAAREPGRLMIGVLVNRANVAVLDMAGKQIIEITRGDAQVVSSAVDESTMAMLVALRKEDLEEVERFLGQKDVSRLRIPPELGEGLPDTMLATLRRRMEAIPLEIQKVDEELARLAAEWGGCISRWKIILQETLEGYQVLSRLGETDSTFVLAGWVPKDDLEMVKTRLHEAIGEPIFLQELELTPELKARAPVLLKNPAPARPFESLVRMLELPRYGKIDPTRMMAFFLPVFFGLMLGDIGYGLIILAASLLLLRKFRQGFARDLATVVAMGAGWSIVFGILFGEVFGTLGESLGLHPIWMARDSADDVLSLLILSVAIGAGHITLGLVLGVFEAFRDRSRTHLLERGGMLLGLIGLFLLVGVLVDFLPSGFMTPAVAGLIIGIVLLSASLGWLGIVMGPIEFIGLIGNVLSYMRIAALGLASVYLAKVANEMAGIIGNVVVGLILAALIHALNLALGSFGPTIHSLRLHYVEFFRKFYEGGGRPYEPYRSRLSPGG